MIRAMLLSATISAVLLSGCGLSVGPQTKEKHHFVKTTTESERSNEILQCLDSATVEIVLEANGEISTSTQKIDKTWFLWRPDYAVAHKLNAPRIASDIVLNVVGEDGKPDRQKVAGWYLVNEDKKKNRRPAPKPD